MNYMIWGLCFHKPITSENLTELKKSGGDTWVYRVGKKGHRL